MIRRRCLAAFLSLALLFQFLAFAPAHTSAASSWEEVIGSVWEYNFTDEWEGLTFSGTWTYECSGFANETVEGVDFMAIAFDYTLKSTVSGSPAYSSVSGGFDVTGTEYYDPETGDVIADVSNQALEMTAVMSGTTYTWDFHEHNSTLYDPPGGNSTAPDQQYIAAGTNWTVTFHKVGSSSGTNYGTPFQEDFDYVDIINVTYLGSETVTVPAGTFYCEKFSHVKSDGDVIHTWYSGDVGMDVLTVINYSWGEDASYELTSYTLGGGQNEPIEPPLAFQLLVAGFIIATVTASFIAWTILRNKKRPPEAQDFAFPQRTDAIVNVPPPSDEPGSPLQ